MVEKASKIWREKILEIFVNIWKRGKYNDSFAKFPFKQCSFAYYHFTCHHLSFLLQNHISFLMAYIMLTGNVTGRAELVCPLPASLQGSGPVLPFSAGFLATGVTAYCSRHEFLIKATAIIAQWLLLRTSNQMSKIMSQ